MKTKEDFIEEMKQRTKLFALDTIKIYQSFPKNDLYRNIGNQLIRSATSLGANYRAACRARFDKEFFSKVSIVTEESDETIFWLEILIESNLQNNKEIQRLLNESIELTKIFSKSRKSMSLKLNKKS
jgi:four helix bundle protein